MPSCLGTVIFVVVNESPAVVIIAHISNKNLYTQTGNVVSSEPKMYKRIWANNQLIVLACQVNVFNKRTLCMHIKILLWAFLLILDFSFCLKHTTAKPVCFCLFGFKYLGNALLGYVHFFCVCK